MSQAGTDRLTALGRLLRLAAMAFSASPFIACGGSAATEPATMASTPRQLAITGYDGAAMEPFVSRDGRFLLFNNSNDPSNNTDLLFARRVDDLDWVYAGPVSGVNSPALEGTPTMDRNNRLFFVSTRSYAATACTIFTATFADGAASAIQPVDSICRHQPGVVNFDVDIDASGTVLTFVDSNFSGGQPSTAILVMATWDGTQFVRRADSASLLAMVNSASALQYAPALSMDHLTLWFTRVASISSGDSPQIWRARRASEAAPFDAPVLVPGLGDFVEAPPSARTRSSSISTGASAADSAFSRCPLRSSRTRAQNVGSVSCSAS